MKVLVFLQFVYFIGLVSSTSSKGYHFYKKVTPYMDVSSSSISKDCLSLSREEFSQWKSWKVDHARVYGTHKEVTHRLSVWLSNKRYVDNHNEQAHVHGFKLEMNSFGDLVCCTSHNKNIFTLYNYDYFI